MARVDVPLPSDGHLIAALRAVAILGAVVAGLVMLASAALGYEEFPSPFAWTDVALVHFLSNLPLAAVVAALASRRLGPATLTAIGLACVFVAGMFVVNEAPRVLIALFTALTLMLSTAMLWRPIAQQHESHEQYAAVTLFCVVVAVGLPWVYVTARSNHDERELAELLDQSRYGEAQRLARQSFILDPQQTIRNRPLMDILASLDLAVAELETSVIVPLPAGADEGDRLVRVQDLAMLGRTREALRELESAALDQSPQAAILRGTILQTRGEYASSLAAFERAAALLDPASPSPDRTADLVAAHSGIAFAHRRLGHNRLAEEAYQRVLELDASADTHFLLAQFYEGAQQAAKAQHHARQAMALAPDRYNQPGQRLIDKLITYQFGCWGAVAAEGSRQQ